MSLDMRPACLRRMVRRPPDAHHIRILHRVQHFWCQFPAAEFGESQVHGPDRIPNTTGFLGADLRFAYRRYAGIHWAAVLKPHV